MAKKMTLREFCMDAIAEAAKIGIAADRAKNYCANSAGTALVYGSMSAISTAFRTGKPTQLTELTDETQDETKRKSKKDMHRSIREAVRAMKEAAKENAEDLAALVNMAKANGGKIPDVNEIAREVLSKKNERGEDQ